MTNGSVYDQLDHLDRKILAELSLDGLMSVADLANNMSLADLANKLGISRSPCGVRFKPLVNDGVIVGFRAVLDPKKADQSDVAFVEIKLDDTTVPALMAFNAAVREVPELEQCHMIAGSFDYLLKVRTKDLQACRQILVKRISELLHVASTATYLSMETVKEDNLNSVL
ncbi:MAG: Lrp/AsnC family leucine-responsive transcriptional regulator [Yoonia sp.]|jgi:Lrp/AsnC family leucine-responsive transcriptional regulator